MAIVTTFNAGQQTLWKSTHGWEFMKHMLEQYTTPWAMRPDEAQQNQDTLHTIFSAIGTNGRHKRPRAYTTSMDCSRVTAIQ